MEYRIQGSDEQHKYHFYSGKFESDDNSELATSANSRGSDGSFFNSSSRLWQGVSIVQSVISTNYPDGISWGSAAIILVNCTVGVGLLNFPYAFGQAGNLYNAFILQFVIQALIFLSLCILAYCIYYRGDVSYQGMILTNCGTTMATICKICIFMSLYGGMIVMIMLIGDQSEKLMLLIDGPEFCSKWYLSRKFIVPVFATIFIYPFCLLKSFHYFKYTSWLGICAMLYITFGVILTRMITGVKGAYIKPTENEPFNFMVQISVICFSYDCHIEMTPMLPCLRKKTIPYFIRGAVVYTIVTSIIYTVAATCGYLTFGSNTPEDILLGYAESDILLMIAMVMILLKIVTIYPVCLYCLRGLLEDFYWRKFARHRQVRSTLGNRIVFSIIPFASAVLIAITAPSVSQIISITGGLSALFEFGFPGFCLMKIHIDGSEWKDRLLAGVGIIFLLLGVFFFGSFTAAAVQSMLQDQRKTVSHICP